MATKYPSIDAYNPDSARDWSENKGWYVEEKLDGSQLSFQRKGEKVEFFNKGKKLGETSTVFGNAMQLLRLHVDRFDERYVYHGEAICSRQHNVVHYERTPRCYFALYDLVLLSDNRWLGPAEKRAEAERCGLELAPILYENTDLDRPQEKCQDLLRRIESGELKSLLGGRPEGIVLKHHAFEKGGKTSATKLKMVSAQFRETHGAKLHKEKATPQGAVDEIGRAYSTEARFRKAFQHLRDAGELTGKPERDLPRLRAELDFDLEKEAKEELKEYLWAELSPFIKKAAREGADDYFLSIPK